VKIIGYVRVSSEEQAREGLSLALQSEKIKAYASLNDYTLCELIEDRGISAKNISGRPGFQRALQAVLDPDNDIAGLIVWKLDRAFRSTINALEVSRSLNGKGKHLISICEKIDTITAQGKFYFTLLNALAELERDQTSERTKVILQSKKSRGEFVGKPRYGLQSGGKQLKIDESQQAVIAMIRDLSTQGLSYRCIAQRLNEQGILTKQSKCFTHKQISNIMLHCS